MGYDIHITRAVDWRNNPARRISQKEWLSLVEADAELKLDPNNGENAVTWRSEETPAEAWFDWYEGNVFTTNPSREAVGKALKIAAFLDAHVQGDDGKLYHKTEDWREPEDPARV